MRVAAVILSAVALFVAVSTSAHVRDADSAPTTTTATPTPSELQAKRIAALWKKRARTYKRQAGKLGAEVRRLRAILRREQAARLVVQRKRARVVAAARSYLGTPYVFASASRSGVDCSGLAIVAYRTVGVRLPHLAAAQERLGRRVSGKLRPGDLVFFNYGGHVGIYVGGGNMIAASSARGRVVVQDLGSYPLRFDGARRLI